MEARLSLLCLPCAGASATMYLRWRRHLPRWIEIIPMELPGRGGRLGEDFVENYDRLITLLCQEHETAMRGHYAIFGHSMGALLAYGVAALRRERGASPPAALIASGSPAPSRRDSDRFSGKDDDAALIEDLRKQGGTPEEVFSSEELMRITLDVLGADYRVCESFEYRNLPPFEFPIYTFGGRQDDIEPERIEAWAAEAGGEFTLDWFDGGHFFVRHQESEVLKTLSERLTRLVQGGRRASRAFA